MKTRSASFRDRFGLVALVGIACVASACAAPADDAGDGEVSGESALTSGTSATVAKQMRALLATARSNASGRQPGGHCYAVVAKDIDTVGYGKIPAQALGAVGSLPAIPAAYRNYAHEFADYLNAGNHAAALGLKRLHLDNPYNAPAGAIVVVRAGAPGTANPVAGDIAIAAGNGAFFNDGEMTYGGAPRFPDGNDFVLGVYVPES